MEPGTLADQVASKILTDTAFWVAMIGLLGGIAGAVLTIIGQIILHWFQDRSQRTLDNARKKLLKTMLEDERFLERWRRLETMCSVIGADNETTKRLLVEIDARGSEKDSGLWGLIKYHPFKDMSQ